MWKRFLNPTDFCITITAVELGQEFSDALKTMPANLVIANKNNIYISGNYVGQYSNLKSKTAIRCY